MLAKQVLYHLRHTFCSGYFGEEVSQSIYPGWPQTLVIPISASPIARITGVSHRHLAGSSFSFLWVISSFSLALCCESNGCSYVSLFLALYSVLFHWSMCLFLGKYHAVFLLLWVCSIVWNQVLWYLQCCSFCSGLLKLFRVFCASKWIMNYDYA
jgi:hypothetical protein